MPFPSLYAYSLKAALLQIPHLPRLLNLDLPIHHKPCLFVYLFIVNTLDFWGAWPLCKRAEFTNASFSVCASLYVCFPSFSHHPSQSQRWSYVGNNSFSFNKDQMIVSQVKQACLLWKRYTRVWQSFLPLYCSVILTVLPSPLCTLVPSCKKKRVPRVAASL